MSNFQIAGGHRPPLQRLFVFLLQAKAVSRPDDPEASQTDFTGFGELRVFRMAVQPTGYRFFRRRPETLGGQRYPPGIFISFLPFHFSKAVARVDALATASRDRSRVVEQSPEFPCAGFNLV